MWCRWVQERPAVFSAFFRSKAQNASPGLPVYSQWMLLSERSRRAWWQRKWMQVSWSASMRFGWSVCWLHWGPLVCAAPSCAWMLPVFTIPRWSGPNLSLYEKHSNPKPTKPTRIIQNSSILLSFVLQQLQPTRSFGWFGSPAVATPISRACLSLEDFFVANPWPESKMVQATLRSKMVLVAHPSSPYSCQKLGIADASSSAHI